MDNAPFEMIFRQGRPPAEQKYPGHGHRLGMENGMLVERDVAVPLRDGARIYINIHRPERPDGKVPALVAWSAYGKHHPFMYEVFFRNGDVRREWCSDLATFEGPDPSYWVPRGYAVIQVDPRGTWHSEGDATYWGHDEGRDGHDLIEWLGVQDWCNGKVGMSGVSYLAIIQWQVAATRPPHLAAINPWEGLSDMYREFACHGGIPESFFAPIWHKTVSYAMNRVEDVPAMMKEHPLFDDYWASKVADFAKIDVPAYVVASWADQGLHTRGTLEGFRRIASQHKWLDIHGRKKWENYYQPESVERQRAFFDHFLKGIDTDVLAWPKVRLEVRERYYVGASRDETAWPLARTRATPLYLDARNGALSTAPIAAASRVAYDVSGDETSCPAAYRRERAQFDHVFAEDTELTGYMKLRLWVEAVGADDMDLFVAVQKFDRDGQYVPFAAFSALEDGPVALGWLRASHRELDAAQSTPQQPRLLHRRLLKLQQGVPVPVEIEIWPSGTRFAAGETLRLVVQGSDIYRYGPWIMTARHAKTLNAGQHVIHAGGEYDSHLLVPVIPRDG
ncbi:MAG: CocE/NonD family hydrolase [Rhodospirillales bacterium]|nr:CocE/NonD family hydrolase [Rhodospirillales bacterium]